MAKIRISYNAPVVLTFTLLAVIVFLLPKSVIGEWFTSHGQFDGTSSYFALFGQILGHGSWEHLLGNFMLILLIGPILEERVGSMSLLIMILITALVSGLVGTGLGQRSLGASGIVFMMILLASTANIRKGEIPLTFIAVALIYLGGEVYAAINPKPEDHVSHLGHLCGGITGAAFGFIGARAKGADPTTLGEKPLKAALPAAKKRI